MFIFHILCYYKTWNHTYIPTVNLIQYSKIMESCKAGVALLWKDYKENQLNTLNKCLSLLSLLGTQALISSGSVCVAFSCPDSICVC